MQAGFSQPSKLVHAHDGDGCGGIRRQRRFPVGAACALDDDPCARDSVTPTPSAPPGYMMATFFVKCRACGIGIGVRLLAWPLAPSCGLIPSTRRPGLHLAMNVA
jgi:hypothetical protein